MISQSGLPDTVTHNFNPIRGRFQNICDLPRSEAESILREIRQSQNSRLKPNYLERRLNVEKWLRTERRKIIGSTSRKTPIYFFVGDFSDGQDPMRPQSLKMRLSAFPESTITFTYSDSMTCFEEAKSADKHSPPFAGRLFTLSGLKDVVSEWGMPSNFGISQPGHNPFIEMQLWDDAPLREMGF